jgi:hypothetical protein
MSVIAIRNGRGEREEYEVGRIRPVTIGGEEGFLLHRSIDHLVMKKEWSVTMLDTGALIGSGPTMKEAMRDAQSYAAAITPARCSSGSWAEFLARSRVKWGWGNHASGRIGT